MPKPWRHMPDVDTEDVDQYGHQLLPGSTPITLRDPATGAKETLLIRKRANPVAFSLCDPSGLVPMSCPHGLTVRRGRPYLKEPALLTEDGAERPPYQAQSWMRSNVITMVPLAMSWEPQCPVCVDGPPTDPDARDDLILRMLIAADGAAPLDADLPDWARA